MADETILAYDSDESVEKAPTEGTGGAAGHYVGIHSTGFRDLFLKPELLRAVVDCGFEHPSEVQHECIPNALLGMDVVCQAKSGMGKTAVFVLATLNQLEPKEGEVSVVVLCHARELAFQIGKEYNRFTKYLPAVRTAVLFGGVPIKRHQALLKDTPPHVVIGTPGRVLDLVKRGDLNLGNVKFFVLDECDKMLEQTDMRADVQSVFLKTPVDKQVMMFSATLSDEVRPICRKFMNDPMEVVIDEQSKLTLHGLQQYYVKLGADEKNRKLADLLDALQFNQVVVFVSKVERANALNMLLKENTFPSITIHGGIKSQEERLKRYEDFKQFKARVLVTTDLFGRGIDIERVNVVINYDFPVSTDRGEAPSDAYLHRVGRAGRFGTKGLAISFVSSTEDEEALAAVQKRFEVKIPELPDSIDTSSYMESGAGAGAGAGAADGDAAASPAAADAE